MRKTGVPSSAFSGLAQNDLEGFPRLTSPLRMTSEKKGKFISKFGMKALKVKVKLFGIFRNYLPRESEGPTFWMEIGEGDTLQEILTRLGIPEGEPKTLVHNHRAGKREQILSDGDVVAVFPPVAGG